MRKKRQLYWLGPVILLLCSCEMFEYHPYDARIQGEKGINEKNIQRIEAKCTADSIIRFAVISDTQRWYDETEACVKHLNTRGDIDFVLHCGDLSDFGVTKEFTWMRDILNKLTVPYVCLIGNHDCLGNGEEVFKKIFGKENFAFQAGNIRFICLNTNALEYDYSNPVPDFGFLEIQLSSSHPRHTKTIVAMHARPLDEQFNNNVAKVFQEYIKRFPQLQFCIHGHEHHITAEDIFGDETIYYGCGNIKKRKYLLFTIKPEDYEYEVVEY